MENSIQTVKAVVTSVIKTTKEGEPLMKKRADGSLAPYHLCGIKLTEGPAKGTTHWAQRTLQNREGVAKEAVNVGDDISVMPSIVNGRVFLEVVSSVRGTNEDLLATFGLSAEAVATTEELEIPLAQ
jgi:hypothetical protein